MEQVGRYQIVEELGRGAMGVVYKALDPAIGRTIAIKAIRLSDLADVSGRKRIRDRLLHEAQSAGVLSHPNIVTVYDILEESDFAYIFMEYVSGSSLEKMLRLGTMPDSAALLEYLRQVSDALDYAHRKGIIHRDIKPANIIISDDRPEAVAKVTDFGVAKLASNDMTQKGVRVGTPSYMSPEQIHGTTLDGRSDQFSLAVMVYELLTGEKPFAGENLSGLLYAICKQEPKGIEQVNPATSESAGKVIRRALAKEPEERFASCGDFIGALSIALSENSEWIAAPAFAAAATAREAEPAVASASSGGGNRAGGSPAPPRWTPPSVHLQRATRVRGSASVITPPAAGGEGEIEDTSPAWVPTFGHETPITRRRSRGGSDETGEIRDGLQARTIGAILAICLAIAGVIVFATHWKPSSGVPVQVLDTKVGPSAPPPPENMEPGPRAQRSGNAGRTGQTAATAQPLKPASGSTKLHETPQTTPSSATSSSENTGAAQNGVANVDLVSDPPGAKMIVDGKPTCTSPCTVALANGRHTMAVELDGYGISRRVFMVPDAGGLYVPLNKSMGVLVVTSTPVGSDVFVDGNLVGKTPATLHLAVGPHDLRVVHGSQHHEEKIQIEADTFETRSLRW